MKQKVRFVCHQCGASHPQWSGQCTHCQQWNSIIEEPATLPTQRHTSTYTGTTSSVLSLNSITFEHHGRFDLKSSELNRVLGGGLVEGSVVLMGGDPGIGKSTLLLQTLALLSEEMNVLYVTGEESVQQIAMRANRLQVNATQFNLLAETHIERILAEAHSTAPKVMVIDSIQTLFTETLPSAAGSVGQIRETAAQLVRYAKTTQTAIFLVGHVTKDGALAGPRILEHMVDTVLYFESQMDQRFRVIRAIKNRFGAVHELGVFAMTEKGLKAMNNPSAIFLSRHGTPQPGNVVMATWEGTRPLLVEVQALVDTAHGQQPKRVVLGIEPQRLSILLAVLHRYGQIATYDQDVFMNVVGGIKITETASDLPFIAAIVSSFKNRIIEPDTLIFGEVGLSGEIRPIQNGQERLKEAAKHGFKRAMIPYANAPKTSMGIDVIPIKTLPDLLVAL